MRGVIAKALLLVLAPSLGPLLALSLSEANKIPENHVIVCERPEVLGLYKQCFEGTVLENLGNIVRVYSLPEKRVVSAKPSQLFSRKSFSEKDLVKVGQNVGIPGKYLWNTAPEGFQSICQVDAITASSQFVSVSCGRYHGEKILRSKVYPLKPWDANTQINRN